MVKFLVTTDRQTKVVGLGLSRSNVELLKKDRPIVIDMGALLGHSYAEVKVCIFYGETEEAMRLDLAKYIGKETLVIDKKRGVEN